MISSHVFMILVPPSLGPRKVDMVSFGEDDTFLQFCSKAV